MDSGAVQKIAQELNQRCTTSEEDGNEGKLCNRPVDPQDERRGSNSKMLRQQATPQAGHTTAFSTAYSAP